MTTCMDTYNVCSAAVLLFWHVGTFYCLVSSVTGVSLTLFLQRGIIATKSGYIFIEPVRSSDMIDPDAPRQHTVYKTASTDTGEIGRCTAQGMNGCSFSGEVMCVVLCQKHSLYS